MRGAFLLLCGLATFGLNQVRAEIVGNNIDPNQNYLSTSSTQLPGNRFNGTAVNSNEAGVLNSTLTTERPQYDSTNNSSGREYKAASAEKDSATGKGVAMGTGIALIATGTVMMMSIEPSIRAAGAELVAKGGLELAQAAADSGSESKNKDQKETLLYNENPGDGLGKKSSDSGKSSNNLAAMRSQMMSPEVEKMLSDRGINSDNFFEQLSTGQLTDAQSVLNAMGDLTDFSDADWAAAADIEGAELNNLFEERSADAGYSMDDLDAADLSMNENNDAGQRNIGIFGDSADDFFPQTASVGAVFYEPASRVSSSQKPGTSSTEMKAGQAFNVRGLASFTRGRKKGVKKQGFALHLVYGKELRALNPKQNIFQVANRFYVNYRKWRKVKLD